MLCNTELIIISLFSLNHKIGGNTETRKPRRKRSSCYKIL